MANILYQFPYLRFFLTIFAFQSLNLCLSIFVLSLFESPSFSVIPFSCFSLVHFASDFHKGMWENLILCEKAQIRAFKHPNARERTS